MMRKIISTISAVLVMLAASSTFTTISKSAEFFYNRNRWPNWSLFPNG